MKKRCGYCWECGCRRLHQREAAGDGRGPRFRPRFRAFWLLFAGAMVLRASEPVKISGRAMGTTWAVAYAEPSQTLDAEGVKRRVAERLEALERMFSTYRESSTVSRFNAARTTEWVPVEREVARVAGECRAISERTGGAFDVTVAPLVRLWGFGPGGTAAAWPSEAEIAATRMRVGFRRLDVREQPAALRKADAAVAVDFSSMAKGFAVDRIGELLVEMGIGEHLAQVGGDMRAMGARKWRVGVEAPAGMKDAVAAIVALADGAALSTSGNYRNAIVRGGREVGHIIDPRTGRPVESDVAAVSVRAASCAQSSAWATGLFVLGATEGRRVAEENGIAALLLVREGGTTVQRVTAKWAERE